MRKVSQQSPIWSACALVAIVGAAAPALAKNPNPGVSPPNSNPHGKSYAEWSAELWKWFLKIPTTPEGTHPALGGDCAEEQSGSVFFIAADFLGTAPACTVPAGKSIFFPVVNVECSSKEPDPFFGADAEELTDCATCWGDHIVVSSLEATLDGVPLGNLDSYRAVSPMFTFEYPADNIFGLPDGPGTGQSVSDGYWIMLSPLTPGEHTLSFSGGFEFPEGDGGCEGSGDGFSFGFAAAYDLTVEGGN